MAAVQYLLQFPERGGEPVDRFWLYTGAAAAVLVLLFILHWFQYASLYLATYKESASRRISLAETLRKLPLSFFGNRDLSDLTSTMISDCSSLDQMFSHYIPQLFASVFSTLFIGGVHVSVGLEDGARRAVGGSCGGGSDGGLQKAAGQLWHHEYPDQTGRVRLHPGGAGNRSGHPLPAAGRKRI